LDLQPSVLVAFNLIQNLEGYALNENEIPQDLNEFVLDMKPRLGSVIELNYQFTKNLELLSRFSVTRRQINDGEMSEVWTVPELNLGLRYKIN